MAGRARRRSGPTRPTGSRIHDTIWQRVALDGTTGIGHATTPATRRKRAAFRAIRGRRCTHQSRSAPPRRSRFLAAVLKGGLASVLGELLHAVPPRRPLSRANRHVGAARRLSMRHPSGRPARRDGARTTLVSSKTSTERLLASRAGRGAPLSSPDGRWWRSTARFRAAASRRRRPITGNAMALTSHDV